MRFRSGERKLVLSPSSPSSNDSSDEEDPFDDGKIALDASKSRSPSRKTAVKRFLKKVNPTQAAQGVCFMFLCFLVTRHLRMNTKQKRNVFHYVNNTNVQSAIKIRHQCIKEIRKKHDEVLLPLLKKPSSALFPWETASILLVDPAYHANVGDNMLTVGEKTFLQNVGWNNSILECDYVQTANQVPSCRKNLVEMSRQASVALWHAGGNWGDLWIDAQWPRIESFYELLLTGFTIVGMPQSLYYKDESMQKKQTEMIKENVQRGLKIVEWDNKNSQTLTRSRLILTWREEESFERALHLYPFATNKLVPDIAFQLGPYEPIRPEINKDMVDILLFMRDDNESQMKKERSHPAVQALLNTVPGSEGLTFSIVDWNDRLKIFRTTNKLFDSTSIKLLSLGKVVICDRLHVAILAYLSGLPFIYLDQVSNKLTKTLRVAFSSWEGCQDEFGAMFTKADSLQDALIKAVGFLDKYNLI